MSAYLYLPGELSPCVSREEGEKGRDGEGGRKGTTGGTGMEGVVKRGKEGRGGGKDEGEKRNGWRVR